MKVNTIFKHLLLFCAFFACLVSCDVIESEEEEFIVETEKNIAGTWQIINVTRNGQNITEKFDFSTFKVNFLPDHTFSIENPVPFFVKTKGTWSVDDPRYPFKIAFEEEGDDLMVTEFSYPIVGAERQIQFTFSPGCTNNTYEYFLQRTSE